MFYCPGIETRSSQCLWWTQRTLVGRYWPRPDWVGARVCLGCSQLTVPRKAMSHAKWALL